MKTILVVDDTAILREPIMATLRMKGYQTLAAANGQEALQIARDRIPDLILLDVAMPVMDGLVCLGELRRRPETAHIPVIMLTAMAERQVVLQAGQRGATGFLLKSRFSTAELLDRVKSLIGGPEAAAARQTAASEKPAPQRTEAAPASVAVVAEPSKARPTAPVHRLTRPTVLQRLTQEIELRSISPVLEHVIALTRTNASTLDDIASAIRQDQALSVRVLRVANSSFYTRGRVATNLMDAVQRIGLAAVRNAVIAILAIEHFGKETEAGLIPQRFWQHSLTTGVMAEMIGVAVSAGQTDHLFLAGLLHDIGRMVLSGIYPKEYAAVIARAEEKELDLETVEMETFELSHVDATRHLLGRWNMPPEIVDAASLHELPIDKLRNGNQDGPGILAVALANRLSHALLTGSSGDSRLLPFHEFVWELGINGKAGEAITTSALEKAAETEMFYASRTCQQFCHPLAGELAKKAPISPRIVVLGPDAPFDPFSLFFKQLGWLQGVTPDVAVMPGSNEEDLFLSFRKLQKIEEATGRRLGLLIAATKEGPSPPPDLLVGRSWLSVSLPVRYGRLCKAVTKLVHAREVRQICQLASDPAEAGEPGRRMRSTGERTSPALPGD